MTTSYGLKIVLMSSLSDNALERLERSRTYLVVDIIFNWIGGTGQLLLLVYAIRWWHRYSDGLNSDSRFWFWLKVLLLSIGLISVTWIKNEVVAWVGIAPPDYAKWFGPKQLDVANADMRLILDAQQRATRIRERGLRVDQLLAENHAIFLRRQGNQRDQPDL